MKSLQQCIERMSQLLAELVDNAAKLRDVSRQVISEEELAPLQKHQRDLLEKIEKEDVNLQKNYPNQIDSAARQFFHEQLHAFHLLNQEFIKNLDASHGLIQFELRHLREGEGEEIQEIRSMSHLNKMTSSPSRSQAVNSQENKKS